MTASTRGAVALLLVAAPNLISCDDVLYGTSDAACRDVDLTWENFGRSFMRKNCTGCHSSKHHGDDRVGAPEGVDFDTYDGVLNDVEGIELRSILSSTMPPATELSALERANLDEWLRCEVKPDAGL